MNIAAMKYSHDGIKIRLDINSVEDIILKVTACVEERYIYDSVIYQVRHNGRSYTAAGCYKNGTIFIFDDRQSQFGNCPVGWSVGGIFYGISDNDVFCADCQIDSLDNCNFSLDLTNSRESTFDDVYFAMCQLPDYMYLEIYHYLRGSPLKGHSTEITIIFKNDSFTVPYSTRDFIGREIGPDNTITVPSEITRIVRHNLKLSLIDRRLYADSGYKKIDEFAQILNIMEYLGIQI